MKTRFKLLSVAAGLAAAITLSAGLALAETVKVAIGQRGLWDTMITHHGIEQGYFAAEGLEVEITWTRGGGETLRAVTTGSTAFAFANGTMGVIGAYGKGAPVRIVSSQALGAGDLFWYAKVDSPVRLFSDTNGRTVGYSRPGSSNNLVVLALAKVWGVKP
ncbi:MAG: ABC transporter substrate-binding protein, partial [bacterium]